MKNVVAVLSGKGGVGKTFLTAALSFGLAFRGKRVLAVDLDMGLRNLDIPFGVSSCLGGSVWSLARGHCFEKDAVVPVSPSLDFLPASVSAGWERISKTLLRETLRDMRERYDAILLDCPAGLGKGVKFAAECAERKLFVAAPSRAALRDIPRLRAEYGEEGSSCIFNGFFPEQLRAFPVEETFDAAVPFAGLWPYSFVADSLSQEGKLSELSSASPLGRAVAMTVDTLFFGKTYPWEAWKALLGPAASEGSSGGRGKRLSVKRQRLLSSRWKWERR